MAWLKPCRKRAKHQIVVLGTRNVFSAYSDLIDNVLPHNQEVGNAVMAIKQVPVEVRLERRLTVIAIRMERILVAVQNLRA